ncbi:MAG TPA: hypothetical protein VLE70_15420, partial [Anaerolineae bacterium]|nr:hypothetical protein [Anaerolineae bacterium]
PLFWRQRVCVAFPVIEESVPGTRIAPCIDHSLLIDSSIKTKSGLSKEETLFANDIRGHPHIVINLPA